MSWPDAWAGSSASAPGLGTTSSSLQGRRRALLRPAVPAGSDLWSSVPAYGRRPVLIRSRPRFAVLRSSGACPSALVTHSLVRESNALGAPRLGVHLLLRACLLMRCPGGDALSPRALRLRPAFQPGHPALGLPLRPAPARPIA